jgi:hypothetical protein
VPVIIPFFAFALGATLDLHLVWTAGLFGLLRGLVTLLVSALALVTVDKLIGGNGTAGIAAATTAAIAAAAPMLVATANQEYAAAARTATVLVASCDPDRSAVGTIVFISGRCGLSVHRRSVQASDCRKGRSDLHGTSQ